MLTHHNLISNILQVDASGHFLHDRDTTIAFLPFFHIYGMVVIAMLGLWSGATLVVMPKFELETYLDLIERHRATFLHVVPPVVVALAKHPSVERRDFSSIRKLFSGAAPLSASTHRTVHGPNQVRAAAGIRLDRNEPGNARDLRGSCETQCGSIGQPVSDTECRVVDPATGVRRGAWPGRRDLGARPSGDAGISQLSGRDARDDGRRQMAAHGDIGHADEDGNFYIVDRSRD